MSLGMIEKRRKMRKEKEGAEELKRKDMKRVKRNSPPNVQP